MIVYVQKTRNGGGIDPARYTPRRTEAEKRAEMQRWVELFIKGKRRRK